MLCLAQTAPEKSFLLPMDSPGSFPRVATTNTVTSRVPSGNPNHSLPTPPTPTTPPSSYFNHHHHHRHRRGSSSGFSSREQSKASLAELGRNQDRETTSSRTSATSSRSGASPRSHYSMPPTSSSLTPAEPGAFSDHNGIQREDNYRSSPPASHGQAPMLPPLKRMASPMSLDLRPASRRLPTAAPTSSPSSVDTNFFRGGEKQQTSCHLRIRQQPEAARACGFGERDRRVIDPPPVLELEAANGSGAFSDIEDLHLSFYSVHASLWSQDGNDDLTTFTQQTGKAARRLVGSLVASPAVATDEQNRRGAFFTFADLSCRETGHFRLRFTLVRIDPTKIGPGAAAPMLASLLSDVFTVYSPKDFPGMRRSTPLTQALKIQGVAIPAKKGRSGPVSKQAHGSDSSRERVRSYDMEGRDVIPHFAQRHI